MAIALFVLFIAAFFICIRIGVNEHERMIENNIIYCSCCGLEQDRDSYVLSGNKCVRFYCNNSRL